MNSVLGFRGFAFLSLFYPTYWKALLLLFLMLLSLASFYSPLSLKLMKTDVKDMPQNPLNDVNVNICLFKSTCWCSFSNADTEIQMTEKVSR